MKLTPQSLFAALRQPGRGPRLLAVIAVVVVAIVLVLPALPRTMRVSYRLPERVTQLSVDYQDVDGEIVRSARFHWADGSSPEVFRHEPELAPGRYVIVVTLRGAADRRAQRRERVEVDGDRITHVDLRDALTAGAPESL